MGLHGTPWDSMGLHSAGSRPSSAARDGACENWQKRQADGVRSAADMELMLLHIWDMQSDAVRSSTLCLLCAFSADSLPFPSF